MAVTAQCLLEAKYAENAQTTQYTCPNTTGTRVVIDKFTASNATASGATLAVNVVSSGGSAAASNVVLSKTVGAGEMYTCPELVGQILNAGDFISTLAGTASAIVIRISGRVVTV